MTRTVRFERPLALALTSVAVAWLTALLIVGLRPAHQTPAIVRAAVHGAAARVCHRRPERSFHIHGQQFPVCARCSGLYGSGAIGAVLAWIGLARMPRRAREVILAVALPTALSWALESTGLAGIGNAARAIAAIPLGGAAGWLFVRMLRAEGASRTCAMIA